MINNKELRLYLHIPFCEKKCAYCDFLSVQASEATREAYVKALLDEIELKSQGYGQYAVSTVFFGGGTPSLLSGTQIGSLMDNLRNHFRIMEDAEVSMECNPGSLTREKITAYHQAGVNRISLGLQSPDNEELRLLGRIHTWEDFLESFCLVREAGFDKVNIDLISGLPGQRLGDWEKSLRQIASLAAEHISAYGLTVEEGTPFFSRYGQTSDEEGERAMYERTREILGSYGYRHYEISNYAKPGKECLHNMGYWTRGNYLGLGLGSASLIENERFSNTRDLAQYLGQGPLRRRFSKKRVQALSLGEQMEEFMFLGLRLMDGVSDEGFLEYFGESLMGVYGQAIGKLCEQGLLERKNGRVFLTMPGVLVSNYAMSQFLGANRRKLAGAYLNRIGEQ